MLKGAPISNSCFFSGDFPSPVMAGEESTILLEALEGLTLEDFQEFKKKLPHTDIKGGWNIGRDELEKVTHPSSLISYMGDSYREGAAMDIAISLFEEMNQRDLAEKILDEKVKGKQPG